MFDEHSNESSTDVSPQPACLNSTTVPIATFPSSYSSSSSDSSDSGSTTSQRTSSDDVSLNFSFLSTDEEELAETLTAAAGDVTDLHTLDPPKLYKLVFDNIDKTVAPRYMRADVQTRSLNYIQIYSVRNRIDFSPLSLTHELPTEISLFDILPSAADYSSLKGNFTLLVARTIHDHIPFFGKDFKGLIPAHIPHQYSENMAAKSEVVSTIMIIHHLLTSFIIRFL